MSNSSEDKQFWDVVYASAKVWPGDQAETLTYCQGRYDYSMDLIMEQRFKEANHRLRTLTYFIDCQRGGDAIDEIRDKAWSWIRLLDEECESNAAPTISFTFRVPPREV